ncbi:MAG: MFS transporter, partial [Chloroflexota bacterium]
MTQPAETTPVPQDQSTAKLMASVLVMRIVMDTSNKLFFPYLSVIAAGLGTTTVELGKLLSWRDLASLVSPFLGATADKRGYRRVISACLAASGTGLLTIYFSQSTTGFLIGIMLAAFGGAGAGPNIVAYLSHRLPWNKRSRGLGIIEYAWGLASIIGVSASGFLIAATSWRMPFLIIGCLAFVFAFVYLRFPPAGRETSDTHTHNEAGQLSITERVREFLDLGPNRRSAWFTLIGDSLTRFAGFLLFINFGTWLDDQFDLGAAGIAAAVFWLGFSDIAGSVSVSVLGDRIGKRNSVIGGTILGAFFFTLLPFWAGGLVIIVIGIFVARACFEFSIVSYLVLASEQSPEHRGKMMTMRVAFSLVSSFSSARFGPQLYEAFDVPGFAWPAAV